MRDLSRLAALTFLLLVSQASAIEPETIKEWKQDDARIVTNTPANLDPAKPTLLLIYLPPNGSTIEMTAGVKLQPGMDWHYDIQHIAAQTRLLRKIDADRNIVVAYIEAQAKAYKLTWPTWRKEKGDANGKIIRKIVDDVSAAVPAEEKTIALVSHSGGGSFMFGYLNGGDAIADNVERLAWIDSNYGYDDKDHHGDKLLAWLKGDPTRHLLVFAYNDRVATLNGKPFVSETGGTFYRSHRMVDRINQDTKLTQTQRGDFEEYVGMNGQIHLLLHTNPEKKILHTVLVERNGLLEALTWNTPLHDKWGGEFWGKRAYTDFVTPAPEGSPAKRQASGDATTAPAAIAPRAKNAMGGKLFAETIADLPPKAREAAIVEEIKKGNVPDFLRKFLKIEAKREGHTVAIDVMPDYLAVGSDDDFVRMPMAPGSVKQIADAFGCTLPTRKLVDELYASAEVKLEPKPMTQDREAVRTFVQHNDIIEKQRAGKPLGALVGGDKKDIVITNRLKEKPNRVAIYGWHKLDGKPIQPLTIVHHDQYVDYSHGVRLIKRDCVIDGKATTIDKVLKDPELSKLFSDEGVIDADY